MLRFLGRYFEKKRDQFGFGSQRTLIIFLIAILFLFGSLFFVLLFQDKNPEGKLIAIPISLHSVENANYGEVEIRYRVPLLNLAILEDIIKDNQSRNIDQRLATITAVLLTPVFRLL